MLSYDSGSEVRTKDLCVHKTAPDLSVMGEDYQECEGERLQSSPDETTS